MSESLRPTKQQIRILSLLYRCSCPLPLFFFADKHGVSVDDVRALISDEFSMCVNVDLHEEIIPHDYGNATLELTRYGTALIEQILAEKSARRVNTRHFWISLVVGVFAGWLLSSLGTPKDALQSLARFFGV